MSAVVGKTPNQAVELPARLGVEPGGGFVQEEQLGPADDADRHIKPTALPAGEGVDPAVGVLGQTDNGQQFARHPRAV